MTLNCILSEMPITDIPALLQNIVNGYNKRIHSVTKYTPFELHNNKDYGFRPKIILIIIIKDQIKETARNSNWNAYLNF